MKFRASRVTGETMRMTGVYASRVRCAAGHSGNQRLARVTRTTWECTGCGHFWDRASVAAAQRGPVRGVTGGGGLATVREAGAGR